jgi:8-oxo-dGTP pyrophosphatase MutT (NUDIX family)
MTAPRITRPQEAPVVGVDQHLPALSPGRLTAGAVAARLHERLPSWQPEWPGDGGRFPGREPRPASVLVPLVQRDDGLHVLLTRRTDHLHDHAGQISFPGGRQDAADKTAIDTALREAQEEVGLLPQHVQVLACLPLYTTVTHYQVTPVVALVQPPFELVLDSFEVAEAFEVPLSFLMNPAHHRRHRLLVQGIERQFLSMPWTRHDGREFFIWGATAAMLRNVYALLADEGAPAAP